MKSKSYKLINWWTLIWNLIIEKKAKAELNGFLEKLDHRITRSPDQGSRITRPRIKDQGSNQNESNKLNKLIGMIDCSSTWRSQGLSLLTDRRFFLALPMSADFHATPDKLDKKLSILDSSVVSGNFHCIDNANVGNFILSQEKWK